MGKFLIRVLINGLALWIAGWILPGIHVATGPTAELTGGADTLGMVLAYLFVGLIFGLVNAVIRPVVSLLTLPLTILTLGLFTVVVNAGMLVLTAWISSLTPVEFSVDSFFWTAIFGALIISVVSLVAGSLTNTRK